MVVTSANGKRNIRQEERRFLGDIRVERVEIPKSRNRRKFTKSVVYNLEVSGHPSYFAEGFLVHNCHFIKNTKAKRTKATIKLGKTIKHIIALSGTPVINRPIEVYNALRLVNPTLFPNFWDFAQKYCGARHNGFGWDFRGASNTEELHKILSTTVMIRRLKSEVLQDLPDKIRTYLPFEISNLSEYQEAEANFTEWLLQERGEESVEKASRANMLVKIEALKQLAVKGKLSQALEWVENFIETDGKLVVFAVHREVVDTLYSKFKDVAVKVDGSVSGEDRDKAVQEFQNNDKIRLFVGNIKAAGVGLTLTAASSVAFLELPWTPGELDQAEDRVHRIGQRESVNIYYLLANGTIEEKIASMLDRKRRVVDAVIDGKETEQESLLTELINAYKGNEIQ
jgi:SNF2 family DNA or RNA helicase